MTAHQLYVVWQWACFDDVALEERASHLNITLPVLLTPVRGAKQTSRSVAPLTHTSARPLGRRSWARLNDTDRRQGRGEVRCVRGQERDGWIKREREREKESGWEGERER